MLKNIMFLLTFLGISLSFERVGFAMGWIHQIEQEAQETEHLIQQDLEELQNTVNEIEACAHPALQVISLFREGTSGMCYAINDATAAMRGCCNGSSPKQVITDVVSLGELFINLKEFAQIQNDLNQACQIFGAGGVDFLKGYCQQSGNSSAPYNCGYAIGQLLPQMGAIVTNATSMSFSNTLSSSTCHSLETVLSNSSCCTSNVQTLIRLVNKFVGGSLNQAIQQQQQLCSGNGEVMTNLVAGLEGCSNN